MEETAPIIMGSMKKLFPTSQGALFLLNNSRSDLESVVTWAISLPVQIITFFHRMPAGD